MAALLVVAGLALVGGTLLDVTWTTVASGSGAGPFTARLTRGLWRSALAVNRRRRSHVWLTAAGVVTTVAVLLSWIVLTIAGWALVFNATEGAVRAADTGVPADGIERLYFTGYTVFTLGTGDLVPGDGAWQLLTVVATGTGLLLVTLSITFLVPVASAVGQRRQLASTIASLGATPEDIVVGAWTGEGFGSFDQHLVSLTPLLHASRHQHLTYPVVHVFHSREVESAVSRGLVDLSQALHLLRHRVAPSVRPDPSALRAADAAVAAFLETVLLPRAELPPPIPEPPEGALRAAGIPLVDRPGPDGDDEAATLRRRRLAALLEDDGWYDDEVGSAGRPDGEGATERPGG